MEATILRQERFDVMREIAIQEKDLALQWRGGKGQLLYVKLKKAKTLEARVNNLITKRNIHEISSLKILKNQRTFTLKVDTQRTTYLHSPSGHYDAPVFYIETPITKAEYERIFNSK